MTADLERPRWAGQRPFFEVYLAVIIDEGRRRALWLRQTLLVPADPAHPGRATIWGSWFDGDVAPRTRAAKRFTALEVTQTRPDGDPLISIDGATLSRTGATGSVEGIAWDVRWSGGRPARGELPAWLPTPTHARSFAHDADAEGTVTLGDGPPIPIRGRALAMHLWGKRRVPTLHWLYAPWLGDGSLELTAISLRDRLSLGLSALALDGTQPLEGTPASAAHPHGMLSATLADARTLVHVHAWAEPDELVGQVHRESQEPGSDIHVAQSAIAHAHLETFTRAFPGATWHLRDERRAAGGVALEIHQHAPLPGVDYLAWDDTQRPRPRARPAPPRGDVTPWPELGAIVALGLTYTDRIKEASARVTDAPPAAFTTHPRAFHVGDNRVRVPDSTTLFAALDALEPGVAALITRTISRLPAVMDYEGALALIALDAIDDARLLAGVPQPFGLAACNALTARMCQVFGEDGDETSTRRPAFWSLARSFEGFLPVADRVWVPPEGVAHMPDVTIVTRVNGEERQRASTRGLAYPLPVLVRTARTQLGRPLRRGDVILTGTPAGVGLRTSWLQRRLAGRVKDRFRRAELLISTYATSSTLLRPGDVVEVEAGPAGSVRTRLTV